MEHGCSRGAVRRRAIGFAFQSTIRNLTQSYSAGHLQLQDWKSLNLMGTATKALKQELIDTAVELGVIKEGEVTIASFESSLQKKWANTEVMEKTFAKYASMMEAAYELTQKNPGMTSSEALEQLKGQYGELAERAALAAQQATSFAQAIDSAKDAVSSKWMAVFETIFGNKEEATDTWTELANRLYDIFVPPIEALNDRMKEGLDSGWQQMRDAFGDQADAYTTVLEKLALAKGAVTEEAIEEEGSFAKALQKGKVDAELLTTSLSDTIKTYPAAAGAAGQGADHAGGGGSGIAESCRDALWGLIQSGGLPPRADREDGLLLPALHLHKLRQHPSGYGKTCRAVGRLAGGLHRQDAQRDV